MSSDRTEGRKTSGDQRASRVFGTDNTRWSILVTALALAAVAGLSFVLIFEPYGLNRPADSAMIQQLHDLDNVQENVKRLSEFIDHQSSRIRTEQELIAGLNREKSRLQQLIGLQRADIERLIKLEEERTARNRWKDLIAGGVVGVASSFLAALLYARISR